MWHVAGDRQHQIVMLGRHHLDIAAKGLPERREPLDRSRFGCFGRGENAPAVDEQLRKARVGSGIFGAGDRVRRHEMDTGRNMRGHVAQH